MGRRISRCVELGILVRWEDVRVKGGGGDMDGNEAKNLRDRPGLDLSCGKILSLMGTRMTMSVIWNPCRGWRWDGEGDGDDFVSDPHPVLMLSF